MASPSLTPILAPPAESVCTGPGALSPANLLPCEAGPLGAVCSNVWASWPRFALRSPAGGFFPLDFPSIGALEQTPRAAGRLGVPPFPESSAGTLVSVCSPGSSPARHLGEEAGLQVRWLLPAPQTFTREIKSVPKC